MKLPPFGEQFQPVPKTGVRVAIGPGAWDYAKELRAIPNGWSIPVMVLPEGENAATFTWPSDGGPALLYERGEPKGCQQARQRLTELALELLVAGASSVVAIREAYINSDPRIFFDREPRNVAA